MNASASQLSEYGFPARPATGTNAASSWNSEMSNYVGAAPPSLCQRASGEAPSVGSGGGGTQPTSANWGGFIATAGADGNTRYTDVEAGYTEPSYHACTGSGCGNPTDLAIWAGLGGYLNNSQSLLQAGTDFSSMNGQYSWYEYLEPCNDGTGHVCGATSEITVGSVKSGDSIFTHTSYDQADNLAHFDIDDNGTMVLAKVVTGLGGNYYDGSTAEWICERPTYGVNTKNMYYETLTDFGTVDFTDARAEHTNGTYYTVAHENHLRVEMMPPGGDLLVNPQDLSDGDFTDAWINPT